MRVARLGSTLGCIVPLYPNCQAELLPEDVLPTFQCKNCATRLVSNRATAIIHGIVIAIATELLLYFILGLWAGDFLVGASAFLLLGGLAAYVIYQVVFPSLLKVSPFR